MPCPRVASRDRHRRTSPSEPQPRKEPAEAQPRWFPVGAKLRRRVLAGAQLRRRQPTRALHRRHASPHPRPRPGIVLDSGLPCAQTCPRRQVPRRRFIRRRSCRPHRFREVTLRVLPDPSPAPAPRPASRRRCKASGSPTRPAPRPASRARRWPRPARATHLLQHRRISPPHSQTRTSCAKPPPTHFRPRRAPPPPQRTSLWASSRHMTSPVPPPHPTRPRRICPPLQQASHRGAPHPQRAAPRGRCWLWAPRRRCRESGGIRPAPAGHPRCWRRPQLPRSGRGFTTAHSGRRSRRQRPAALPCRRRSRREGAHRARRSRGQCG